MGDLDPFASATTLLSALRRGAVGSAELTDLYIRRIERHDRRLNAVVVRDFDRARQAAKGADQARGRNEAKPLLGLPITLKESINVTGLGTTCGVPDWKGYVSAHDGAAAARTREAGAVLLGKTNVPPMLADWQSANPIFGRTSNPWDLGRTPGGSSGGSAAAIAAGLSALEVGSDIGGPSETLLPRSGQFPMPPMPNPAVVMGVQGPLARSAEDLELALAVLAGPDVGEDVAWKVALPPARRERLADFRVAVLPPIPWHPVDEQIWAAQQDLVARLGKLGCVVKEAQPEGLGDHREYHGFYRTLLAAITGARMDAETRRQRSAMFRALGDDLSVAQARGFDGSASDFLLWHGRREQHRAAWRAFFRDWDVLLAPAINVLAYPHIERAWPMDASDTTITLPVNGQPQPYLQSLCYPALSNVPGQPATAFPVGVSREGLPIGLQAIGPYLEDLTPIRFTALLAREVGGFRKPAGYDES